MDKPGWLDELVAMIVDAEPLSEQTAVVVTAGLAVIGLVVIALWRWL